MAIAGLERGDGGGAKDVAVGAGREDGGLGLDDENRRPAAVEHGSADDAAIVRQEIDEHGVVHNLDVTALGLVHQGVHHGHARRGTIRVLSPVLAGLEGEVPRVGVRG